MCIVCPMVRGFSLAFTVMRRGVDPLAFAGVGTPRAEMFLPCGPTTTLLQEPGVPSNGSLALIQWRISLNSNTHATVDFVAQRGHPSRPALGTLFLMARSC